jgi:transcriptional regulator with XRE-family HTH domain
MDRAGKRQADLARETGVDKGAMSNYLKGKYEPKQDVVYKLAQALNVSEMWLWGYDCKMDRTEWQKNNDAIAGIVKRLRTDSDFREVCSLLYDLDSEKIASVKQLVSAFQK